MEERRRKWKVKWGRREDHGLGWTHGKGWKDENLQGASLLLEHLVCRAGRNHPHCWLPRGSKSPLSSSTQDKNLFLCYSAIYIFTMNLLVLKLSLSTTISPWHRLQYDAVIIQKSQRIAVVAFSPMERTKKWTVSTFSFFSHNILTFFSFTWTFTVQS